MISMPNFYLHHQQLIQGVEEFEAFVGWVGWREVTFVSCDFKRAYVHGFMNSNFFGLKASIISCP